MRYTKACQMESTRLNNAAFGSSRIIDRDVVIGGYQVQTTFYKTTINVSSSRFPKELILYDVEQRQ